MLTNASDTVWPELDTCILHTPKDTMTPRRIADHCANCLVTAEIYSDRPPLEDAAVIEACGWRLLPTGQTACGKDCERSLIQRAQPWPQGPRY